MFRDADIIRACYVDVEVNVEVDVNVDQNSKTTFIVQTFPKYGPYGPYGFGEFITFGRDFGHISILWIFGLILALFPL